MRINIVVIYEYKNDLEDVRKSRFLDLLAAYIERQEAKVS